MSSFAIISPRKRELVALIVLSYCCHVAVTCIDLCLFLTMSLVGLQRVILAFPRHTHLLLESQDGGNTDI